MVRKITLLAVLLLTAFLAPQKPAEADCWGPWLPGWERLTPCPVVYDLGASNGVTDFYYFGVFRFPGARGNPPPGNPVSERNYFQYSNTGQTSRWGNYPEVMIRDWYNSNQWIARTPVSGGHIYAGAMVANFMPNWRMRFIIEIPGGSKYYWEYFTPPRLPSASVTAVSDSQLDINVTPNHNPSWTEFRVDYYDWEDLSWKVLRDWGTIPSGGLTVSATGLDANTRYYYAVWSRSNLLNGIQYERVITVHENTLHSVTVSAIPESRDWEDASVTVALTYSDNSGSGINQRQYRWSTSTVVLPFPWYWLNYNAPVTQSVSGTWYLQYRASTNSGNFITGYFGPYRVDRINPNPPAINFVAPPGYLSGQWTNSDVVFSITGGTDAHSGVNRTEYRTRFSAGAWSSWQTYSTTVTVSAEGATDIEARTIDNVGLVSTVASAQVRIDKTPPDVSASPTWRDRKSEPVIVNLSFSDAGGSGFQDQRVAWSTSTLTPVSGWSGWSSNALLEVIQSSGGAWYLHAEARDNAGNITTTYFGPYHIAEMSLNDLIIYWVSLGEAGPSPLAVNAGSEVRFRVIFSDVALNAWVVAKTGTIDLSHHEGNTWSGIFNVPIDAFEGEFYDLDIYVVDTGGDVHIFTDVPFVYVSGNILDLVRIRFIR